MSYKIEITAETITELTGKLLALAAATQPDVVHSAAQIVPIDTKPKLSAADKKALADAKTNKADNDARQALQDVRDAAKAQSAVAAEPATLSDDVGNGAAEQEQTTAKPVEPETPAKALDFDKDVAPVVLNAVKVHSKEWVQEVLSQFGVARASQVPDEQLQELVAVLSAGPQ